MQGLAVANDIPPCIYHTPHGPNIGRYRNFLSRNVKRSRDFSLKKLMPPVILSIGMVEFKWRVHYEAPADFKSFLTGQLFQN
jgi:hypothetical protein